ncbi:glycosyltransferase family 2 protein [Enteroscipio rubneri]|uniref:Glycosyltransferase n=1 Tax=Enteroscipio rubneri TaxID=2070686 RepID=A0A2K2UEG5_9ACTN|nr:glycosyltransferase family 2 protein [Enteroscipio rubneri]PNV68684.1 glycosyltransferase [Enteroscipio rubneri]
MADSLVSCVIPCYCSSATISAVIEEIERAAALRTDYDLEIILVNDGSPDDGATARAIATLAEQSARIVAINLARNFGQHAAIMAGFAQVHGDIVVCLDDDGQTPADEMFKLVDKVAEGYDIVYASYSGHKQHNIFRNMGSKFNYWCNHVLMGIPRDLEQTSYFACKRFVVDSALRYENPYPYIEGLLFQAVQSYCNVPIVHRAREVGASGYSLHKLVSLWANGFTAFSVVPLRIATIAGLLFAVVGFVLTVVLIVQRLLDPSTNEGWTSLMAGLLVIGGLIMLLLGVLGEYVGRIYLSLNKIPQYVVRDVHDRRPATHREGEE